MHRPDAEFVQLITASQSALYSYIVSLVGDVDLANEILQNTNLVLWNKSGEFEPGSKFRAWAFRIAHFEVLTARKKLARDRHVFTPALIEKLSTDSRAVADQSESRQRALKDCLEQLPPHHHDLIDRYYRQNQKIAQIAEALDRKAVNIRQMLHRIRLSLMQCIRHRMAR